MGSLRGYCNPGIAAVSSLVAAVSATLQTFNPPVDPIDGNSLAHFVQHLSPTLVAHVVRAQPDPLLSLAFFTWASSQPPALYFPTPSCYAAITAHLLSHSLFSAAHSLVDPAARPNSASDPVVAAFVKAYADRGDLPGALHWFRRADAFPVARSAFSYNVMLSVMVRANRIDLAQEVFDGMRRSGKARPDVTTFTTMIRGLCKAGRVQDARRVFDEMSPAPNLITCNTMIDGLCRKGLVRDARGIVDRMIDCGEVMPDAITFTTLINGYRRIGDLGSAVAIVDEMVEWGCEPNLVTFNSLVHGFCLEGKVEVANKMVARMVVKGFKPDEATHTSLMKGYSVVGRLDHVVGQFNLMKKAGIRPDAKSYGIVVNECCKVGNVREAMAVMDDMKCRGVGPLVGSFNAVLRALCELGEVDAAVDVLKQVSQPTFVSYSTVVCGLCGWRGRMRDVEEIVVMMVEKGRVPDTSMYNLMMKGYCENDEVGMALHIFKEMVKKRLVVSLESFSLWVRGLCDDGMEVEAEKGFVEMSRRCHVMNIDSYRRVLDEQLNRRKEVVPGQANVV